MAIEIDHVAQQTDGSRLAELLSVDEPAHEDFAAPDSPGLDGTPQPGQCIGRYKLLQAIGEGAFGVVFLAEQQTPVVRRVALKLIKAGMDTRQVIARFEAERQALAIMDHPGIAKVFDAGQTMAGRPYFVMELVQGLPITQFCDRHRLTLRERLELFLPVCRAVQHAHQKGIIHRDLKPVHVLVDQGPGGKGLPKVIDFGVAKALHQPLTEKTLFTHIAGAVGTLEYMSPEQTGHDELAADTRSDIYSLGVLLYELVTGVTPLDGKTLRAAGHEQMVRAIREQEPLRPTARLAGAGEALASVAALRRTDPKKLIKRVSGELDWIVMKCLEKERSRRYQTADALARDIERHLNDEPIEACAPSASYRLRKFIRKHRLPLGVAAGFALLLVAATIVSTWQAARATRAKASAWTEKTRADGQAVIAKQQADAAERQLQRADAFNQVMRGILFNVHPTLGSTGRDLRVVDLLSAASREAESRFKSDPQAEIEFRTILAETYHGLGENLYARDNLDRAYQLSDALPGGAESEQTLELAAELARYGDLDFAQSTYSAAVRRFGEGHRITQKAASSLASALSREIPLEIRRPDRAARAEQILRDLAARAIQLPPAPRTPAAYDYMNQLAVLLDWEHKYADAEAVAREALARAAGDSIAGVRVKGALAFSLVDALIGQKRLTEAADVAGRTLAYDRANVGNFDALTTQLLHVYARLLCRIGRADEADRLLEENLRLARAVHHDDDDSVVDRIADLAQLRLDLESRDDALPLLIEVAKMQRRLHGDSDPKARLMSREALLVSLGSTRQPADGTLRAQIFCALEDLWRDNPQQVPEQQDLAASDVHYSLIRWGPAAPKVVAQGTLADSAPQPEPGLHLLCLEVSTRGGKLIRQAMWVLVARWKTVFSVLDEIETTNPEILPASISGDVVKQAEVPSVAIMNELKDLPERSARYLGLSAQTALDLPSGRYRFSTTSGDGVRLYVDGRRVINAWSTHRPRRDFCDLELEGGRHEVRLDYFQQGRRVLLWVRVEPISAASQALAASHGGHALRTLQRAIDEQGESRGSEARATRAALLASAGRYKEAAADYAAAIDLDPQVPLWWQQSALICLKLDDSEGYRTWRKKLFGTASEDRVTAARNAIVAMLGVAEPSQDEVGRTQLKNADPASVPPSERTICQLAQGLYDYRAGRYDSAIAMLGEASAGRLTAEARAAAELFRAMALHHRGNKQDAYAAFDGAEKAIAALPAAGQAELDAMQVEDRLLCQLAAREAQTLFGGSR